MAVVTISTALKSIHGKMSKFIITVNIEVTTLESVEFRRNMTSEYVAREQVPWPIHRPMVGEYGRSEGCKSDHAGF